MIIRVDEHLRIVQPAQKEKKRNLKEGYIKCEYSVCRYHYGFNREMKSYNYGEFAERKFELLPQALDYANKLVNKFGNFPDIKIFIEEIWWDPNTGKSKYPGGTDAPYHRYLKEEDND